MLVKNQEFWHGTDKRNIQEEENKYPIYLSTSFTHALSYSRDYITKGWHPLYKCQLKKDLNIFCAEDKKDYDVLYKYLIEHNVSEKSTRNVLHKLQDRHWLLLGDGTRSTIIKIIKFLKYDGYFNWEVDEPGVEENPSYCIFNRNNISVEETLNEQDIKEYIVNNLNDEWYLQKMDYIHDPDNYIDEYPPLLSKEDIEMVDKLNR